MTDLQKLIFVGILRTNYEVNKQRSTYESPRYVKVKLQLWLANPDRPAFRRFWLAIVPQSYNHTIAILCLSPHWYTHSRADFIG